MNTVGLVCLDVIFTDVLQHVLLGGGKTTLQDASVDIFTTDGRDGATPVKRVENAYELLRQNVYEPTVSKMV